MKTKRKIKIQPLIIIIILAAALLGVYALRQSRNSRNNEIVGDEHEGLVEVFNGEKNVWVVPQSGVELNTFNKEDFIADPDGNMTYVGREYKAARGIDVSSHQGEIDWNAVYDSGVRFAIIRAGGRYYESGEIFIDENFRKNLSGAIAAGLDVGVYFYSQALTEAEAIEEANTTISLINGVELQLPVFLDWERGASVTARTNDLDGAAMTDCAVAFCEAVKAAGYDAGVYLYCDTAYYGYELSRLQDYTIWFAGVGSYPYFRYAHTLWQYDIKGHVPGIYNICDLDMIFYK